jgi:agmatine deiminase
MLPFPRRLAGCCALVAAVTIPPAFSFADEPPSGGTVEPLRSDSPFAGLWNEQLFVGPSVLRLGADPPKQAAHYAPNDSPNAAAESGDVTAEAGTDYLAADFSQQGTILVAAGWLGRKAPDTLIGLMQSAEARRSLTLLVASPSEKRQVEHLLADKGIATAGVRLATIPADTGWLRDYGPLFVRRPNDQLLAIDAVYGVRDRRRDDAAATAIARLLDVPVVETSLRWEGGNLLSNGQGLIVTTTQSINANIERGLSPKRVKSFLHTRCGARQVAVLEPLPGERTGHADLFACFTSADTIVVASCEPDADAELAAVLNRNAAMLEGITHRGRRLRVVRLPMAPPDDGVVRSHLNVMFANGTVFMPTYAKLPPSLNSEAMAVFRRLIPGWDVVGVESEQLARAHGGLRCVSLGVPELVNRDARSSLSRPGNR